VVALVHPIIIVSRFCEKGFDYFAESPRSSSRLSSREVLDLLTRSAENVRQTLPTIEDGRIGLRNRESFGFPWKNCSLTR
jgi:hypothetical protein